MSVTQVSDATKEEQVNYEPPKPEKTKPVNDDNIVVEKYANGTMIKLNKNSTFDNIPPPCAIETIQNDTLPR